MVDKRTDGGRVVGHPYSPSWCPSVDGQGCLHRDRLADGTYSLRTCKAPAHMHKVGR